MINQWLILHNIADSCPSSNVSITMEFYHIIIILYKSNTEFITWIGKEAEGQGKAKSSRISKEVNSKGRQEAKRSKLVK